MFTIGKLSLEALVWEDVADFRRVTRAVRTLEERKSWVFQLDSVFCQQWSVSILEEGQLSSLRS